MRLTWNGWPLHHTAEHGWGWLEPAPPDLVSVPRLAVAKVAKTATKSQPDAVFPLAKLLALAAQLGRPVPIRTPQPAPTNKRSKSATPPLGGAVTDEDWEKINDMTPEEQRCFFAQSSDISGYADLMKKQQLKVLPVSPDGVDQELSQYFSEDVEMREFQAKFNQSRKPSAKITAKKVRWCWLFKAVPLFRPRSLFRPRPLFEPHPLLRWSVRLCETPYPPTSYLVLRNMFMLPYIVTWGIVYCEKIRFKATKYSRFVCGKDMVPVQKGRT